MSYNFLKFNFLQKILHQFWALVSNITMDGRDFCVFKTVGIGKDLGKKIIDY